MANAETLVAVVSKNKLEEIRVRLSAFKGSKFVDLRIYADFSGADAEKRPTKRGVALAVRRLPELVSALQDAAEEARRQGLIEDAEP